MVPPSGDLHIHRVDLSDGLSNFVCTVRDAVTGRNVDSTPYSLTITGECSLGTTAEEKKTRSVPRPVAFHIKFAQFKRVNTDRV